MPSPVATQRILTLDASTATASAGLVEGDRVLGSLYADGDLAALPSLVAALLATHGRQLDGVAVTVGPGSFTGLRAAIALAHGVALAAGLEPVGVTVGAAFAEPGHRCWTAIDSKRGRIFLERDGAVESRTLDALPLPAEPILLSGDAAAAVAAALAARGATVRVHPAPAPDPAGIARAARAGPTRPALPLYVEPPAARPGPPGRPAPV